MISNFSPCRSHHPNLLRRRCISSPTPPTRSSSTCAGWRSVLAEFSTWTPSPRPCPSPSSALSAALTSLQHGNGTKQPKVNGESNMCETSDWCVSVQDVHILSVSDLQLTKKVKINNFNSGLRGSAYLNTQSWDYFCKC